MEFLVCLIIVCIVYGIFYLVIHGFPEKLEKIDFLRYQNTIDEYLIDNKLKNDKCFNWGDPYICDGVFFDLNRLIIDKKKKKLLYVEGSILDNKIYGPDFTLIDFKKIIKCEIVSDDKIIASNTGIKRAVVGGILAGGAGAVVGAMTTKKEYEKKNIELNIYLNSFDEPCVTLYIDRIENEIINNIYAILLKVMNDSKKID